MAKPLDINLSLVWNRESVNDLRITDVGGFVLLARAAVLGSFDPFNAKPCELENRARATPKQWKLCKGRILAALEDALPMLRQAYQLALQKRQKFQRHARRVFAASNERNRQKGELKRRAHNFASSPSTQPITFQPEKAPRYRPENTDQSLRTCVLAAMKDKPGTKRFTEKI